jgi:hypothetical protein
MNKMCVSITVCGRSDIRTTGGRKPLDLKLVRIWSSGMACSEWTSATINWVTLISVCNLSEVHTMATLTLRCYTCQLVAAVRFIPDVPRALPLSRPAGVDEERRFLVA